MVYMGLETAMRRGEILNIRKSDVNLKNKTLLISDTKNCFPRVIPLSKIALMILTRRSEQLESSERQFPTTEIAFRMAWRRVMGRAKLKDFHFHDLRREAIARFLELGLSVPEVALISGHRCYKMLYRYVSLRPENVAAKLARLSAQSK
ncbi:site-specific integrase [Methylobacterium brachiatum]|uniref:site-specific integrase n=1 Tax=Methylobacterium brachiatum TaxID=269660 RepID=UPI000EFA354B|nr:site-specific integrase [Methylobacterium brachiatum]